MAKSKTTSSVKTTDKKKEKKKEESSGLGSGLLDQAWKALRGRNKRLDEEEAKALGQDKKKKNNQR